MSQILVATHSTLAEGFAQAVKFFKADADNVHFLNGYVQSQEFERELREQLDALPKASLWWFAPTFPAVPSTRWP